MATPLRRCALLLPVLLAWLVCTPAAAQAVRQGESFPPFAARDAITGEPIALEDLRGKVVLIDFWATWCGPCIRELPNVKRVYRKHHDEGFDIVSISLDTNRGQFERFVRSRGMTWHHIMQGGGWNTPLAKKYNVRSIPQMYLLDHEGKVISTSARGSRLESLVADAVARIPAGAAEEAPGEDDREYERAPRPPVHTEPALDPAFVLDMRERLESAREALRGGAAAVRSLEQRAGNIEESLELLDKTLPLPRDREEARERFERTLESLKSLRHDLFMYGLLEDTGPAPPDNPFEGVGRTSRADLLGAKQALPDARAMLEELQDAASALINDSERSMREIELVLIDLRDGRGNRASIERRIESIEDDSGNASAKYLDPWKRPLQRGDDLLVEVAAPLTDAVGAVDSLDAQILQCKKRYEATDPESDDDLRALRTEIDSLTQAVENAAAQLQTMGLIDSPPDAMPQNPFDGRRLRDRRAWRGVADQIEIARQAADALRDAVTDLAERLDEFENRLAALRQSLAEAEAENDGRREFEVQQRYDALCTELLALRDRLGG